MTHP